MSQDEWHPRVLLVEDSAELAQDLEEILVEAGCKVATVGEVGEGLALVKEQPVDVALLDVRVGRESVFPLAGELRRRGIKFVFHTGYDPALILPPEFQNCPCLEKPATVEMILASVGCTQAPPASLT